MGITSILAGQAESATMDPMQAKIMMIMPVAFTVMFVFFRPPGAVLGGQQHPVDRAAVGDQQAGGGGSGKQELRRAQGQAIESFRLVHPVACTIVDARIL